MGLGGWLLALAGSSACATADLRDAETSGPAQEEKKDPFAEVQMKVTHVAGHVYLLEGAGGNIGVSVGDDGVLIVDDQFAPLAPKIREAIGTVRKDAKDGPLKFVLNTHWHSDHTGSNVVFGEEAMIVAHDNVRERLSKGVTVGDRSIPPAPEEAWPVVTFDESLSVHFNGERIRIVHLPGGHTDGDAMVLFEGSKVVHMGDDFVTYGFPFVDLVSGGSALGLRDAVAKALTIVPADYEIIPGHGEVSTVEDMKGFHRMLDVTITTVEQQHAAGVTLADAQAKGLGEEWKDWAGDFVDEAKWIELIWQSLDQRSTAAK